MIDAGCLAHKAIFKVMNRTKLHIEKVHLFRSLMNQRLYRHDDLLMPLKH